LGNSIDYGQRSNNYNYKLEIKIIHWWLCDWIPTFICNHHINVPENIGNPCPR
jgi:hypothetical protein